MRKIYMLLLLLFLTSCGNFHNELRDLQTVQITQAKDSKEEVELSRTLLLSLTPSLITVETLIPTPTVIWPVSINRPTISLLEKDVQIKCLDQNELKKPDDLQGTIAYIDGKNTHFIHLLDLQNNKDVVIPEKTYYFETFISPDQTKIASGDKRINVISSEGKNIKSIYIGNDLYLSGWLNNQELIFKIAPPNEPFPTSISIINPFNGSSKVIKYNYPQQYTNFPGPRWFNKMYDPNLTRVVYPTSYDSKWLYGLFNLDNGELMTMFADRASAYSDTNMSPTGVKPPEWYQDGSKFAIALNGTHSEMYVVTRDGEQEQVTNLLPYFPEFYIEKYYWSPDGKYIALVGKNDYDFNATESQLLIIDTITKQSTFLCLQVTAGNLDPNNQYISPIYWSPDSKKIIYENIYSDDATRALLVDLEKWTFYEIGENMQIIGWLKN